MREPSECSTEEISDVKTASQLNEWEHCDPAGRCGDGRASTASPRKNGPKDDVAPYVSNGRHGNVTDSVHSSQRKDVEQRLDAKSNGSQLERQQVQVLKRNDELSRNGDDGRSPLPIKKRRAPEDDATADVSSTDTGPENGTVVHSTSRELDGLPNSPLHDNNKRELSQLSDGGDRTTNSKKAKRDILRQARSERKRCREKQRRSDVNKGFEDLTALLMKIDPAASSRRADDTSGDGLDEDGLDKSDSQDDNGAAAPTNRVELIGLTVNVMERLYKENLEMKDKLRKLGAGTPVPQIHADDLGNKGQHQVDKDVRSTANRRNNPDEAVVLVPVMVPYDGCRPPPSMGSSNYLPWSQVPPGSVFPMSSSNGIDAASINREVARLNAEAHHREDAYVLEERARDAIARRLAHPSNGVLPMPHGRPFLDGAQGDFLGNREILACMRSRDLYPLHGAALDSRRVLYDERAAYANAPFYRTMPVGVDSPYGRSRFIPTSGRVPNPVDAVSDVPPGVTKLGRNLSRGAASS